MNFIYSNQGNMIHNILSSWFSKTGHTPHGCDCNTIYILYEVKKSNTSAHLIFPFLEIICENSQAH